MVIKVYKMETAIGLGSEWIVKSCLLDVSKK